MESNDELNKIDIKNHMCFISMTLKTFKITKWRF